jgi:transposase-like protein
VLVIDAKVVKIKGVKHCEYLAVDTDLGLVHRCLRTGNENTYGYRKLLEELQQAGYTPLAVVSDGGTGIYSALRYCEVPEQQRCHVHLLRDLQRGLRMQPKRMRKDRRKWYLYAYAKLVLDSRTEAQKQLRYDHFQRVVLKMWQPHGDGEKNVIKSFVRTLPKAFTFMNPKNKYLHIPTTSNLVEGYISHFNTRLKTTRGLKNSANAEFLLNTIHLSLRS